jgi:hypothetical protein
MPEVAGSSHGADACEYGANISLSTRVHARVTRRRRIPRVCGAFVAAGDPAVPAASRLSPRMVRRGSTVRVRQRASERNPCKRGCFVACVDASLSIAGTPRVHVLGLAGTRGHARRLASPCDTRRAKDEGAALGESPCKQVCSVALMGERRDPSLERRGSYRRQTCSRMPVRVRRYRPC